MTQFSKYGRFRTITGTNPAANVEVSETIATNFRCFLHSFSVVLVTDGNAANRNINLIVDDGTSANRKIVYGETTPTNITATLTRTILYTRGNDAASAIFASLTDTQTVLYKACLPPLELKAGDRIRTVTASRQVGDDYAAPIYVVEEWLEG